ncbi:forkhead box protein Q1 [Daphnia magna]|uniref:forkhead box protein Q1 n=1 Tax=Daphnia magna TaxID=35525 RepID=UPI0006DF4E66|nr:forkhead box protein Q1 [Daphnia magna]XP_045031424.1 forkhead box protein Q1 [Daphnia magna]XP_045031425.1 forkhead box protein Q1 [Daphnia magna]
MDMYSNSGIPSLTSTSFTYSAMHDPLALPDFCDFDGKNDLMDCSLGFSFPELSSFGGLDLDKLDQLVRMEADLERIERLERLEVEVGSLDSDGESAISFPPTLIGPSLGLSGWAPSDMNIDSSLSHGCSVTAAMDSDSTDVVVNPLSVLPVSSSASSLSSGWSSLLHRPIVSTAPSTVNVPSPMPASPAPQGSPISLPTRIAKSIANNHSSSVMNDSGSIGANNGSGFPKPAYSYSCLIALALKNSRTGCLPVSEIYRFMCEHFPYFRTAPAGWKNSVRHNLSLNKCFEKVEKLGSTNPNGTVGSTSTNSSSTRKGCLWTLSPAKATKMDEEVLKWSRKDPSAIKRAMAYPDALEMLERGEMKMESAGGASTESEDEGEGPEEEVECPSPLARVTPPEPSPPLDDNKSSTNSNKEQLNIGVSIVSRLAPPITGRRPSVPQSGAAKSQPQKVYYSLPKFQTSGNELIIIGDSRMDTL